MLGCEIGAVAAYLEALAHPALFGRIRNVHELGADGAAVGAMQVGDDLAQRGLAGAERCFGGCAGIEGGIQIRFREAVVGKL